MFSWTILKISHSVERPKELYQHNVTVHKPDKPCYSCEICGEKFRYRHRRDAHAKMRHELSDMIIDENNLSEVTKDPKVVELLERRKKHDIPNFICKICDKIVMYGRSAHIAKHNAEHDGLKCPKCDQKFAKYQFGWFEFVPKLLFYI